MNYYKKLLSTNILISTLYILIFTIIICSVTYFAAKRLYINNLHDSMENISEQAHAAATNAKVIANVLSNNEIVKNYANETEPDYANRTRVSKFLYDDISIIMSNNATVSITKYSDNHVISSISTSNFDYYYKTYGIDDEQMDNVMEYFESQDIYNITYIVSDNNKGSYMHVITRNYTDNAHARFFVIVTYPINTLLQLNQYQSSVVPFMSINNDIIYLQDEAYRDEIKQYLNTGTNNKHTIFSFTPKSLSFRSDITYNYIVSNKTYFNSYYYSIALAILLCIPLFPIGILIMRRITKKIYSPVNTLVSNISTDDNAVQNEFEYVMNTFTKLDSDNKKHTKQIAQFKISTKEKFICDLIFGILNEVQITQGIEEYGLPLLTNDICAVIINYVNYESLSLDYIHSYIYQIKEQFVEALAKTFSTEEFCHITETSLSNHVLIVSAPDKNTTRTKLQTLLLQFMHDTEIEVFAAIGNSVESYYELCDSYTSALDTIQRSTLFLDHKTVVTPQDVIDNETNHVIYLPETESSLISAIATCNYSKVNTLLSDILRKNYITSKTELAQIIIMFYSTIQKALYKFNFSEEEVFGQDTSVYLELKSASSITTFRTILLQYLNTLMNYIEAKNSVKDDERSAIMIKYIEEHYNEDFSLLDLAEHMNMSQEYTSRIFKQEIGVNYKEYIMKYRYRKAKELLDADPTMLQKDVAAMVGCTPKTLARLFNKYE